MKKRLCSGLLAAVLLLALAPAALAASAAETDKLQVLAALEIFTGDADGNLNLASPVTRAEFTKMAVAASPLRGGVGDTASVAPYPDVPKSSWAAPWIQAAVAANLVRGNLSGYFEPNRSISLAEGVTVVLRLLGYQDSAFTGTYPAGQMAMYRALKLDKGIMGDAASAMCRADAMNLFYNLMTAKTSTGAYYLNTLRIGAPAAGATSAAPAATAELVNAAGEIDRVALVNAAMEGPLVADAGWQSTLPFAAASATVYRDGTRASLGEIGPQDVVYYSKPMRTLWAYHKSVTGTLEKRAPAGTSAPTSVTVAGKDYAVETTAAAYALSDLGAFRVGDTATLLLGRTGGVAAVQKPGATATGTIYGVVTGVNTGTYQDSNGDRYQSDTVQVKTTTGGDYSYSWKNVQYFKPGDLVRITTQGGDVQVKRMSMTHLSGKVSRDGTQLGTYTLASDVNILDTYGKTGILHLYPARLAGMNLTEKMVKFYACNTQGEISDLILDDATGDLHRYGILTGATENDQALQVSGVYACILDGTPVSYTAPRLFHPKTGPVEVKAEGTALDYIRNLTAVKLDTVDGNVATAQNNQKYTLSEQVAVYEKRDENYYLTDLGRMTAAGLHLTGYYDKPEADGGRIRVILASAD